MNRHLDECKAVRSEIDEARHPLYPDLVHRHCARCGECARYLEQTSRLIQLVSGYKVATPADFDRKLFNRVAELKGRRHWIDGFMTLSAGLRLATGAMATALVVFAVYSTSTRNWLSEETPSPVAVEAKLSVEKKVEQPEMAVTASLQPPPEVVEVPVTVKSRVRRVASQDARFAMGDGSQLPVSTIVIGAKPVVDVSDVIRVSDSEESLSEGAAIF